MQCFYCYATQTKFIIHCCKIFILNLTGKHKLYKLPEIFCTLKTLSCGSCGLFDFVLRLSLMNGGPFFYINQTPNCFSFEMNRHKSSFTVYLAPFH